jgi:hypothetical protein
MFQVICNICNQSASLENCKTDELGQPVHEGCYVSRLTKKKIPTSKFAVEILHFTRTFSCIPAA